MTADVPVLIVGAGPSGLTLACELARRGVACRVVDKAAHGFVGSRAKGLQPRTLEVFDDLGVIDAVTAGGAPFPSFRLYAGSDLVWERSLEQMLGETPGSAPPGTRHPRAWLIPQWRTDQILHDRFVELGGRVERASEVTGLVQGQGGVTATVVHEGRHEAVRARYLVGADGGRSFVRKATGVQFHGESLTTEQTLIGDVMVTGLHGTACHILTNRGDPARRFSLWNLPGSEHYQLVATVGAEELPSPSLAFIQQLLDERSGRADIRLHDLRWVSLYRVSARMVERFRTGNVLLAGDAAHVHSSAGGQGLNTSIQDAYNLGWKLAAVVQGAPPELLDTYEEERLPVAAHVLGLTSQLHRVNFRPLSGPPPALHQLDLTYRGGALACDDRASPGALRAGDRAPEARMDDGRSLCDVRRGTHWTLLAFARAEVDLGRVPVSVRVEHPHALEGYDVADGDLVLIRPDGHIGVISSSLETVRSYCQRLAGAYS